MASSFKAEATSTLREYIDLAIVGEKRSIPGAILHVVDTNGATLFSHASGGSIPLSEDTLFLAHSLTKIIGAIAFMQLVDAGLVSLDDPSVIESHLPELAAKKILTGFEDHMDGTKEWLFEDRNADITPRMLMNHTYGGGHSYFNPLLLEYLKDGWEKRNEASDPHQTVLDSPLLWQPGTHTNYGQGFDWLAVLIERLTNRSLQVHLAENVFDPLGMASTGFEEQYGGQVTSKEDSKGRLWPRNLKNADADGGFIAIDPPVLAKVERASAFPKGTYHTYPLGTGLVSSAADLARILAILLPQNAGVDPITGTRILSPESVKEITSPQLAEHLRNNSRVVPTAVPAIIHPANLQSAHMDPEGSYGFGCGVQGADRVLPDGKKGRRKGSAYWYGLANTEFWVDGEKGIVVVVNGNYIPWNDGTWVKFVAGAESRLYDGLV